MPLRATEWVDRTFSFGPDTRDGPWIIQGSSTPVSLIILVFNISKSKIRPPTPSANPGSGIAVASGPKSSGPVYILCPDDVCFLGPS
ncbi:hypothetical protein O1611_g4654 [Lasiodiplodia mahajangana]|uniref:Uncharacterized protein n=1 Tax=Lasiodiplodia mahajangana TaxID=1108764 RepID=A0ACC2JNP6_9PEZI|nr:hypothetical protein O1611_g4654 [Lasiodiplodia mahajangana]